MDRQLLAMIQGKKGHDQFFQKHNVQEAQKAQIGLSLGVWGPVR